MSNSESSINDFSSLPVVASLWRAFSRSWLVSTYMVCESKYGLGFLAAMSTTYAIFFRSSYL